MKSVNDFSLSKGEITFIIRMTKEQMHCIFSNFFL